MVIYAANAASLLLAAISAYATVGHRLVDPGLDNEAVWRRRAEGMAVTVMFTLSIAISFLSTSAATYSWLLLLAAGPVLHRVWPRR